MSTVNPGRYSQIRWKVRRKSLLYWELEFNGRWGFNLSARFGLNAGNTDQKNSEYGHFLGSDGNIWTTDVTEAFKGIIK